MKSLWIRSAVLGVSALCVGGVALGQDAASAGSQGASSTMAQDKMFVKNAAEGSTAEIQLSQMALKKSHNDEVKQYAQKMVDDHTKLISDMKPFADQMGVTPPTTLNATHKAQAARLRSMTGDKFDKEYVTAMVADHHKDLADFTAEGNSTANPDLKNTVMQGTQVIKQHTDMIDQIAQKDGIATPRPRCRRCSRGPDR